MKAKKISESGIGYFQGIARDFTPVTVSADFKALKYPDYLNDRREAGEEIQTAGGEKISALIHAGQLPSGT